MALVEEGQFVLERDSLVVWHGRTMARSSVELQLFYVALIIALVGLCIIPSVQCSGGSRGVYSSATKVSGEGMVSSPQASPSEAGDWSTHYFASPKVTHLSALSTSLGAVKASAQQQPRHHLHRTLRSSVFSMLPRGTVYIPPGPSLGSNSVITPALTPPNRP